jgi:phosphoserine phosphatase
MVVGMTRTAARRPSPAANGLRHRGSAPATSHRTRSAAPAARAVLTVTGPDRPGAVDTLFAALARPDPAGPVLELVDVGQVVLGGQLILHVGVRPAEEAGPRTDDALLARLVRLAAEVSAVLGVHVQIDAASTCHPGDRYGRRCRVTVWGQPLSLGAVAGVARAVATAGGTVEAIRQLSSDPLTGVEITVVGAEQAALCSGLATVAGETGADIAVDPADGVLPGPAGAGLRTVTVGAKALG